MKVPNSQVILYLDVNLSDILKFVTGAPAPPPVGFTPTTGSSYLTRNSLVVPDMTSLLLVLIAHELKLKCLMLIKFIVST